MFAMQETRKEIIISKRTKSEVPGSVSTGGFFIENLEMGNIVYVIIRV